MSLLRRAIWPAALAMGFLVFLGAIGQGDLVKNASAAAGDLCRIEGPFVEGVEDQDRSESKVIPVGSRALLVARTQNNTGRVSQYDIDLDDESGDSDITTIFEEDSPYQFDEEPGTDQIDGNQSIELSNFNYPDEIQLSETYGWDRDDGDDALNDDLEDEILPYFEQFGYVPIGDLPDCGSGHDSIEDMIADCIDNSIDPGSGDSGPYCDEDAWESLFDEDEITVREIAKLIADLIADEELECAAIAEEVDREIIGLSNDDEDAIVDDIFDLCAAEALDDSSFSNTDCNDSPASGKGFSEDCDVLDNWWDDLNAIVVTCKQAGEFEVTWTEDGDPDQALTIKITCAGEPSSDSTISVRPNKVEIVPAMGNVSHSLITVTLIDEDGNPAGNGFEVDFTTNICSIEVAGVDTWEEFDAADKVFRAYNVNVASSAAAVEASAAATAGVDNTRGADTVTAFDADGDTVAAAILGCGPSDTGSVATPGTATIQAIIEVLDGQDIIKSATVTVVGPPADLRVTASPSTLRCGEKATITATVKDSIGQNVSEHTRVEAVTNAGGVLGGTGAVAGGIAPVAPVSSTLAETFDGVATFYLLTSEQHSGPYEVVVTTGGAGSVTTDLGGVFSTRPQVAQQTVTCTLPAPAPSAPAPAPTISAPRTGTGPISPPNTGDGGLLDSSSSSTSWTLFAVVGAVAFAVAGLATLKFSRR